jgi:hypothetical protein
MIESLCKLFLEFGHSLGLCIDATQGKVEACFFYSSSFVIRFGSLPPNRSKVLRGSGQGGLICRKHASPHLVHFRRLHRGLCGQGAHAYASIDHVDSRARYCRLDYRRRRDSPILSAKCRGQISSRRINCFNRWGGSRFVHLAQVQAATASRIGFESTYRENGGCRFQIPGSKSQIRD